MSKIRILIVDDHPLMRQALRSAIEDEPDLEVVGESTNGLDAVEQAQALRPDVTVMDLFLPGQDGVDAIAAIRKGIPEARILALTSSSDEKGIVAAVRAGALGYLVKDAERDEILRAVREVCRGNAFLPPHVARKLLNNVREQVRPPEAAPPPGQSLSRRESEVLKLIGRGASNREIAAALHVSEGTVRVHVRNILGKLRLENRNQAIVYAMRVGLAGETG